MDWLHCNSCFCQPGNGTGYCLTNCGHIYCERCVSQSKHFRGGENKCMMCGAVCTVMKLTSKLKPEVECFFMDPIDLVKKYNKQILQVMDFQRSHRKRLTLKIRERMASHSSIVEKAEKAVSNTHSIEREIMKLREENAYLKRIINEKGIGGSLSRTPIKSGMTSSPGGYKASPTRSPMSSYQAKMNLHSTPSSHQYSTPVVATSRLTARTPPTGGKIGNFYGNLPEHRHIEAPKSVSHPIQLSPMTTSPMHVR